MKRTLLCALVTLLIGNSAAFAQVRKAKWQAGVAKIKITPKKRMWMSGYASRTKPAQGTLHDLWAKALVLQAPDGKRHVLVTVDVVGVPRDLSVPACKKIMKKFKLPRSAVSLSSSHTHTGPVVRSNLIVMYKLDKQHQQWIKEYGDALERKLVTVVGMAVKNIKPAQISWGIGKATFAVNRRENPAASVPKLRAMGKLKGPFDHDVPVLAVREPGGNLRAVVFGYACHATVLSDYKWSGDYPGFAQIYLEQRHNGAVALFWAGCGGDQNPLPRRKVTLAMKYGKDLADAVDQVLEHAMKPLTAPVRSSYREIELPFSDLPTREALVKQSLLTERRDRYIAARAKYLLKQMQKRGKLSGTYPYPIQVWQMGDDLTWVILGGEVVVDYSLRLKKKLGPGKTWVMGYANDVMAYIPSKRVLKEGRYEGATSMIYYGMPTVWRPRIEEMIVAEVLSQTKRLKKAGR